MYYHGLFTYNRIENYQSRAMNQAFLLAQSGLQLASAFTTEFEKWPTKLCLDTSFYLPFCVFTQFTSTIITRVQTTWVYLR